MTNLTEQDQYEDGIYQIEKSDPVVGGADGISNRQAGQLANRTRWLKARLDSLFDGSRIAALANRLATPRKINGVAFDGSADITVQDASKAPLDSPALTGKPTAPRPTLGTTSDQLQTAAGVLAQLAAFGIGARNLTTLTDLDDKTLVPGLYLFGNGTKGTAPDTYGAVLIASQSAGTANSNWANQVFFGTRGKISFRNSINLSDWSAWTTVSMAESLAKVATSGRFTDLPGELQHWLAGKSAANGWKSLYLQNQEPTGNLALEMANAGGWIVGSIQGVQDGNGGWSQRLFYTPPGDTAKDRRVEWLSVYTDGVVKLGGATLPAGRTGQILTSEGDQNLNGTKRFSGEVQTTNPNSWRHVNGDYGYFWRNDGDALYLLLTAKGDAYGSWNSLRPLAVNLATGRVAMSAGLETLTPTTNDSSNTAANTTWVQAEIARKKAMYRFQSSGTWTCPTGVTKVWISGCGGGAGGGGAAGYDSNNAGGTGGGSGGGAGNSVVCTPIDVVPGTAYAITIGGGGSGGISGAVASAGGAGNAGGTTAFGSLLSLAGGVAGAPGNVANGAGGISAGIGATSGSDGQSPNRGGNGGSGGGGPFGTGGGGGRAGNANGQPGGNAAGFGTGGGGGGGGYAGTSGTGGAGGAGMPGLLIIEH